MTVRLKGYSLQRVGKSRNIRETFKRLSLDMTQKMVWERVVMTFVPVSRGGSRDRGRGGRGNPSCRGGGCPVCRGAGGHRVASRGRRRSAAGRLARVPV